jgi:O-antigen ligase
MDVSLQLGRRSRALTDGTLAPVIGAAAIAVVSGIFLGIVVVAASPLYTVAGLIGIVVLAAVLRDLRVALFGFVAVATLLPFGVIPIPIGLVKLTLVDVCLTSALLVGILRLLADRRESLRASGVDLPVLLVLGSSVVSFVLGTAYQTTAADARLFLKYLNSVIFFFVVVNWVRDVATLRRLLYALALGGALAGAVALGLYAMSADAATRLLLGLSRVGYPDSNILQYIAGTHTQRAIGTSIDPNILGATLMMCATLTVGLLFRRQGPFPRALLLGGLVVALAALLLTYSRGSLVGFFAGGAVIATLRYRRLWLIAGLILAALFLSGQLASNGFVAHLQSGIEVKDQAAAMRLGEYKDAFRLIGAYPWFGVGFGSAPDVDLYIGVSSIYLLIAENVGLIGLAIWLWAMASIVIRGIRRVARVPGEVSTLRVACLGALVSALVAGIFDHHFADIQFPHVAALVWLLAGLLVTGLPQDGPGVYFSGADVDGSRDGSCEVERVS